MTTNERRERILMMISESDRPIPAKELAMFFNVSRQVIVQDMAVIRASVENIISTNRGYIIQASNVFAREFKVQHGAERMEEELNLFVDYGCTVKNVSISHRVYGRVTGNLNISSRRDVLDFLERLGDSQSSLLGNATSGYHYHLVEASSEERLDQVEAKLKEAGLIVPLLPWEQENKGI